MRGVSSTVLVLAVLLARSTSAGEDGPLTIADLAAHRAALDPSATGGEAKAVTFRDLWDRPAEHRGGRVTVSGRVRAVFHRPSFGSFPPLAEVWAFTPSQDPLCLVFPESGAAKAPRVGAEVRFEGTFLRRVRYNGGDGDRLAPLVVGPAPPRSEVSPPPAGAGPSGQGVDRAFLLVVVGVVALAILRVRLRRPGAMSVDVGPPPQFRDGAG